MSQDFSSSNNVRNDEIDLLDLFRKIFRGLAKIGAAFGKAILITLVFLIRRWLPLMISVVIGLALSIFLQRSTESYYTADIVLKVNIDQTDEVIAHINRLQSFGLDDTTERLADAIGLTPAQTDNIREIKAFWVIDKGNDGIPDYTDYEDDHNIYDTINVRMTDRMDVRVRILQPQELSNVRDGIMKYINSDQLFQKRNQLRLSQNAEMLERIKTDIQQLDSLQKFKYFEESRNLFPRTGGQMVFLQEQKTQLLHEDIYNLYVQKRLFETNLNLYSDIVTALSEFSIPAERDNGVLYYAKILVPSFFLFTLLIFVITANKKRIREVFNKY